MRTDDELRALGEALEAGRLFTDADIPEGERPRMLPLVFMPLALMDDEARRRLMELRPYRLFEYREKAGARGVNGLPMFFSCQTATEEEWAAVLDTARRLREARERVLAEGKGEA